jgi:hypothetical protein
VKQNTALKQRIGQLESHIASDADSMAREKKLMETTIRSAELSTESRISSAAAAAKSECDAEKRRLIGIVAEEFRTFLDPNARVDLVNCQHALHNAKEELNRATHELNAIRRITGAGPGESLADAVTQLAFAGR